MKSYYKQKIFIMTMLLGASSLVKAQFPVKIHSHNDYKQTVPFYEAYSQKVYSIESDMFYQNGEFYVSHTKEEINSQNTFERLYLNPLVDLYHRNGGKAWANADYPIQLMLEIKSDNTKEFMNALIDRLKKYPEVFDPSQNPNAVHIVITGHVPSPSEFSNYPSYIGFDGDLNQDYTPEQLKQVPLFSTNFQAYSRWNGKGIMVKEDRERVEAAIKKAHNLGKPIRFWGAPDGVTTWNTFCHMRVDYINTDKVEACTAFFHDWYNKNAGIGSADSTETYHGVTKTDRLDKTTHNFEGFRNDKLRLDKPVETYAPTFLNDGKDMPIDNVILLIGDGMGLAQITSADRVNKGLTMLNMKHIGLINTSSLDAFTTDSAGGGSALSTGRLNSNRHISISDDGKPYPELTDEFTDKGKACGVVTLGDVADATPAVFYAHNVERDNAEAITKELLNGKLTLLAGSGISHFTLRDDGFDLKTALQKKGYGFVNTTDSIAADRQKQICIDERMSKATDVDHIDLLAETTRKSIEKLAKAAPKGFFLMVEGAKIDYAGHSNCFPASVMETLGFDKAVAEALKFADKNGRTLVIVTADHETGGLTLVDGNLKTGAMTAVYMTDDHTPIMVPVFAYGPHSNDFIGKYYQYEVPLKVKAALGVK